MKPIAIFYHCLFYRGGDLLDHACKVTFEQMEMLNQSGLLNAAEEFHVGVNGGTESHEVADLLLPAKAKRLMHGLESRAENLTLVALEKWLPSHPGWNVLYFHAKGATRDSDSVYDHFIADWRGCMMKHCVLNWRTCVAHLDSGFDAVGAHWMSHAGPLHNQNIFAGNFWWAATDYLSSLPSIFKRDRIKQSGIASLESRYEAEVWIGNGPRLPRTKDLHRAQSPACSFNPSIFMRGS